MVARIEAPWAKVPIDLMHIPGITLADVKVYVALDHASGKRGRCVMTQAEIMADTHISSDRTIRTSVAKLAEHGYIAIERTGWELKTTNQYFMLARTAPAEGADQDYRSVGSELPVGQQRGSAHTISDPDLLPDLLPEAGGHIEGSPSRRLWDLHNALTLKLLPPPREEAQIERWVSAGVDDAMIDRALAAIRQWKPRAPWPAFKHALGQEIAVARGVPAAAPEPVDPEIGRAHV